YSVARWLADVASVVAEITGQGRVGVIVGGTGLYFKARVEGLSPVPPIPEDVRERWRAFAAVAQDGELHGELARRDPVMAARLAPRDRQRLTRALEVVEATGRSLAEWQTLPGNPLVMAEEAECLVVDRPRADLHRRADQRFDAMVAEGALDEVAGLKAQGLDSALPVMRALGVAPLLAHLNGELALPQAIERGKIETRQYIKRQATWLRRNMSAWRRV
ncbi:MAG: tRNA (adenosine(37)-N6)-dimethylallyltransferase MiaA, partial [Hyphomicrobiaceae bacterium]